MKLTSSSLNEIRGAGSDTNCPSKALVHNCLNTLNYWLLKEKEQEFEFPNVFIGWTKHFLNN